MGAMEKVALGKTGWQVAPVGFGGYRVNDHDRVHDEALKLALRSGCNLIDTSANYTDGGSERLIGRVLEELMALRELQRDDVVVVTKAGYIQGSNMQLARERAARGIPFSEVTEHSADLWHCISPDFLEEQLTRSLSRLKLARADVLLLHNPEYFLKATGDHGEYYRRIRRAFEHLEGEARKGRIRYYGISSNTFPEPKDASDYTSLETVLELARELGAERFGVIQFPMNLIEAGAALERNNSGATVVELARQAGLGTLVNRPLNAFGGGGMVRLADFPAHAGESVTDRFRAAITRACELETRYEGKEIVPVREIAWGHIIKENFYRLGEITRWSEILEYEARPTRDEALEVLEQHDAYRGWCADYREASDRLFSSFTALLESNAAIRSKNIAARLDEIAPELASSDTLSRKALRVYRSIPGVDCVLVGMRRPEYVRDALSAEPPIAADRALEAISAISEGEGEHPQ